MREPLVTIACITYNHAKYIRDAIEGFLMQKTTFPIEIRIFDDASTDGTQEIIKEYAEKDDRIITFLMTENQWSKGKYGLIDWIFPSAKGKYIALCEGDDYWTDPYKLQKQVDFLEANKDYVLVYGLTKEIDLNGTETITNINDKDTTGIEELLERGWFIRTGSIMFRNNLITQFPEWYFNFKYGDYMLQVLLAQYGKIKKLDFISSVYRKHPGGISNEFSKNTINFRYDNISLLKVLDKYFNSRYKKYINKHIRNLYARILIISISSKIPMNYGDLLNLIIKMNKKMFVVWSIKFMLKKFLK
ncbi:MAG: hypothetical protein KatS3mg096_896 [Candidatus Parcubacteria bacterium]|nr:MAG: hypothetical protein KatS3mg096_896 [Candidatus Parcubacteria bacterium]